MHNGEAFHVNFVIINYMGGLSVPAMVLDAERACRAMSGWEELWAWRPGSCCSLGIDITCCPPSEGGEATSRVCWEGTVVGGKCGGLIFSAISCSFILSIRTRLSSCKSHWLGLTGGMDIMWRETQNQTEQKNGGGSYQVFSARSGKPHWHVQMSKCTYSHAFLCSNNH